MSMFNVFMPQKLPKMAHSVFTYAPNVMDVANKFGFDMEITSNEFALLLHSLIDDQCRVLHSLRKE